MNRPQPEADVNDTTHRDIRQQLFQALDLITAREAVAEFDERGWLSMVRGQLNNAVCWTTDAERCAARVEAARGVES